MTDQSLNEGMYSDEKVANEWNSWVKSFQSNDTRTRDIYPYLSKWIAENRPGTILEIGSGQGVCSEKLDFNGAKYIGVEPSKHLRDLAQRLYPDRDFRPGKAEDLPFEDGSMDAAYSSFVLLHIQDLKAAAEELARVVVPHGAFAIVTANPRTYDLWLSWHKDLKVDGKKIQGTIHTLSNHVMYLHTMEEIEGSLRDAGLVITDIKSCGRNENSAGPGFALIIAGHKPQTT